MIQIWSSSIGDWEGAERVAVARRIEAREARIGALRIATG
jgi:hypothetical protein